jgi:glycosyltransferase involved in cell wall biosynthesis
MTRVKVTALIPTYNCDRYVCEAVESAVAQTYPAHEIIVVDDGSTDKTRNALRPYAGVIKYIYQNNAGPPAARNTGIAHAAGDIIALLDSDDVWLPKKLELQMEYLQKHPDCSLVYSDNKTFDANGVIEESVKASRNVNCPSGYIFPQLFADPPFQTSAVLIRKECFDKVGLFDTTLRMGDDYEFFMRVARSYKMGYVDLPLVMYRQHAEQGTRSWGRLLQQGVPWEVMVLKRILERDPAVVEELGKNVVSKRLSKAYFNLAYAKLGDGDHRSARRAVQGALRYWPTNPAYLRHYLMTFLAPRQVAKIRNLYQKLWGTAV